MALYLGRLLCLGVLALANATPCRGHETAADQEYRPDFETAIATLPVGKSRLDGPISDNRRTMAASADQVPLDGAGKLTSSIDLAALPWRKWSPAHPVEVDAQLWFDDRGKPVDCSVPYLRAGWSPSAWDNADLDSFRKAICDQFKASGRFRLSEWYAGEVRRGFVNAALVLYPKIVLNGEVRFLPRGAGPAVELQLNRTAGGPLQCRVASSRIDAAGGKAICDAFLEQHLANAFPKLADESWVGSFRTVAYVKANSANEGLTSSFAFSLKRSDLKPAYAPIVPAGASIPATELGMRLAVDTKDNPYWVKGDVWNGVSTIQVAIAPNGKITSCVPVKTSGSALLDNTACAVAVRKGKAGFPEGKPKATVTNELVIRWQSPD